MNAEPVIEVEGLVRRYGSEKAVDGVAFAVRRGEIFGLLGPNGAGKTTTVECLQGLRRRDAGRIEVLGVDPARHPDRLRGRIGSQLQSSALPDRLRVGEALALFARGAESPVDIDGVLRSWGLTALRRMPYATLSGGQRQRLFLALALLGDPEIVFLDELTAGLDPTARRTTWGLVRGVRDRGATVVLVTHFMEEAEALCDRVAVVDAGRVVALDSPETLVTGGGNEVGLSFTLPPERPGDCGNGDVAATLAGIDGVGAVEVTGERVAVTGRGDTPVRVAAALAARQIVPDDFRTHHPTLEDVFLRLTGRSLREGAAA